jgi:hypothetical protein
MMTGEGDLVYIGFEYILHGIVDNFASNVPKSYLAAYFTNLVHELAAVRPRCTIVLGPTFGNVSSCNPPLIINS